MVYKKLVADTGIFIEHLRAKDKTKTTLFSFPADTQILISAITLFELYVGATTNEKWNDIQNITSGLVIIPITSEISIEASSIFLELKKENNIIEFCDIFIAATSRIMNILVKTFNKHHFKRIKGITVL